MERSLYYVRLLPGAEARYDAIHRDVPGAVVRGMRDAGLGDVSGFRRGTDVWWYAEAEPDRDTAFSRAGKGVVNRRWGHQFRDVIAEIEAPGGGHFWYDEILHVQVPAPGGPHQRGLLSVIIDPHMAEAFDALHAQPPPATLESLAGAGVGRLTGFRRGAHVVYVGRFYPDVQAAVARMDEAGPADPWAAALEAAVSTRTDAAGRSIRASEIYHQD